MMSRDDYGVLNATHRDIQIGRAPDGWGTTTEDVVTITDVYHRLPAYGYRSAVCNAFEGKNAGSPVVVPWQLAEKVAVPCKRCWP